MSLELDEHRHYLADSARIEAFRRAIDEVVRPGDVVLDLGAGTGILGLLACRAGAKRVHAIEEGAMIGLARQIATANGFGDRIVHHRGLSTHVELPERVDVVVADQIGRFGFEAGILDYFTDARARFLRPGGVTIPAELALCVAPLQSPELFAQLEFWSRAPAGFDFHPARAIAANTGYPARLRAEELLGPPERALVLSPLVAATLPLGGAATLAASRAGTLHGLGGWFEARLSPGVTMTNSPLAARPIGRMQVFLPLARPVALGANDRITVGLRILPAETILGWTVEAHGTAGTERFVHSTLQGMLLCKEDLERTDPRHVPRLSPRGEARRSVLELCDGRRPLGEIEREIHRRHAPLFRSFGEAAAFVTEVVTRYAK